MSKELEKLLKYDIETACFIPKDGDTAQIIDSLRRSLNSNILEPIKDAASKIKAGLSEQKKLSDIQKEYVTSALKQETLIWLADVCNRNLMDYLIGFETNGAYISEKELLNPDLTDKRYAKKLIKKINNKYGPRGLKPARRVLTSQDIENILKIHFEEQNDILEGKKTETKLLKSAVVGLVMLGLVGLYSLANYSFSLLYSKQEQTQTNILPKAAYGHIIGMVKDEPITVKTPEKPIEPERRMYGPPLPLDFKRQITNEIPVTKPKAEVVSVTNSEICLELRADQLVIKYGSEKTEISEEKKREIKENITEIYQKGLNELAKKRGLGENDIENIKKNATVVLYTASMASPEGDLTYNDSISKKRGQDGIALATDILLKGLGFKNIEIVNYSAGPAISQKNYTHLNELARKKGMSLDQFLEHSRYRRDNETEKIYADCREYRAINMVIALDKNYPKTFNPVIEEKSVEYWKKLDCSYKKKTKIRKR